MAGSTVAVSADLASGGEGAGAGSTGADCCVSFGNSLVGQVGVEPAGEGRDRMPGHRRRAYQRPLLQAMRARGGSGRCRAGLAVTHRQPERAAPREDAKLCGRCSARRCACTASAVTSENNGPMSSPACGRYSSMAAVNGLLRPMPSLAVWVGLRGKPTNVFGSGAGAVRPPTRAIRSLAEAKNVPSMGKLRQASMNTSAACAALTAGHHIAQRHRLAGQGKAVGQFGVGIGCSRAVLVLELQSMTGIENSATSASSAGSWRSSTAQPGAPEVRSVDVLALVTLNPILRRRRHGRRRRWWPASVP